MRNSILRKSLVIAASLPLLAGCVVYEQPPPPGPEVEAAPPPPQTEVVTAAPGPVSVWFWVPGEWVWQGSWVWVGGRWAMRPYAGAVWVHGGWGWHGNHHVWVRAHWR